MAGNANADERVGRIVRLILIALTTAGGGFSLSQGVDLFNAKAWQDANVAKLMEAERTQDRLLQCKAKVDAYEQQNAMLVELVDRMQQSRVAHGTDRETLPSLPGIE